MARPSRAIIVFSDAVNSDASLFTNSSTATESGRVFFFLGGISPALTRSCTLIQSAKFAFSSGSYGNAVKSRPASFVRSSWHSTQCFSMNDLAVGNIEAARNAWRLPAANRHENATPTRIRCHGDARTEPASEGDSGGPASMTVI